MPSNRSENLALAPVLARRPSTRITSPKSVACSA
jgi:hypothetical protein